jgi:hypothetical protein
MCGIDAALIDIGAHADRKPLRTSHAKTAVLRGNGSKLPLQRLQSHGLFGVGHDREVAVALRVVRRSLRHARQHDEARGEQYGIRIASPRAEKYGVHDPHHKRHRIAVS